jgi:hypothetical protein
MWLGRQDSNLGMAELRGMTLMSLHISPDCEQKRAWSINGIQADSRLRQLATEANCTCRPSRRLDVENHGELVAPDYAQTAGSDLVGRAI